MEKLLVTMTGHNPIEKLMPCLELLAIPGMTVIFALPYPVESLSYSRDHRITVESANHATAVGRKVERYNWDAQKEVARRIIAPAVGPLKNKGLQVEIHVCASSLAKIIENYSGDKDIQWIVSELPRSGLIGYWSAKRLVPSGGSSHLLAVRADRSFSRRKRQRDTLPVRHRYLLHSFLSNQRVPVSVREKKGKQ